MAPHLWCQHRRAPRGVCRGFLPTAVSLSAGSVACYLCSLRRPAARAEAHPTPNHTSSISLLQLYFFVWNYGPLTRTLISLIPRPPQNANPLIQSGFDFGALINRFLSVILSSLIVGWEPDPEVGALDRSPLLSFSA